MKKLTAIQPIFGILLCLGCVGQAAANPQWTTQSLHPVGADYSSIWGLGDGQACGITISSAGQHAALWAVPAGTHTDLHPSWAVYSYANATRNGQQGGLVQTPVSRLASIWSGDSSSWVNLGPYSDMSCFGTDGSQQVGYIIWPGGWYSACVWDSVATTFTDLNPGPEYVSQATGVAQGQQVGYVSIMNEYIKAVLWTGSAGSIVELGPDGSGYSQAFGTDGTYQVGEANIGGENHACLWNGSKSSLIDLNPFPSQYSYACDVEGGYQAGGADVGGSVHASLWQGTEQSWVDLHQFLPAEYQAGYSYAWALWIDGTKIYVAGEALNAVTGQTEAMLWKLEGNSPPVADAGQDQTLDADPDTNTAAFGLNGSGSSDPDGDALTYEWTDPLGNVLTGAWVGATQTPGTYEYLLTVTDPDGLSDTDTVTVTVLPANHPPVANAGPDQTVTVPHDGSLITSWADFSLDGSGSSDLDGDSLTYEWFLSGGRVSSGYVSISQQLPAGTYFYTLRVTDPSGAYSEDDVTITVLPEPNRPPVAEGGPDFVVQIPHDGLPTAFWNVTLDGSLSYDPDGDSISGGWGGDAGPAYPIVVTLGILTNYQYDMTLHITDSYGITKKDRVRFRAEEPNLGPRPVVDNVETVENVSVEFDVMSNDSDPDGDPISFVSIQAPVDGSLVKTGTSSFRYTPAANWTGNLTLGYVIKDSYGVQAGSGVKIKVKRP